MLTTRELELKLAELRALTAETEVVEFKEAKNNYDFIKLGKYFSALCNEANLKDKPSAWLVFGIRDKDKAIVNSQFRSNKADLDSLKAEIANKTTNRITFIEIYELTLPEGRIVLFEIPAAPKGIPIAWEGHYYGRDGEELQPLNLEELERIRFPYLEDWSAVVCPDATIEDLDPNKDYYLATLPMLLAVDKIYEKIRKLTYRYIKEGTLFPDEVPQYEPYLIREAINNCIAHQDYSKGGGRINVIEKKMINWFFQILEHLYQVP